MIRLTGVRMCVRKTLYAHSVCSTPSILQLCVSLLIERGKRVKKTEEESDVRKDERKSQWGREEGAGMKGTAERCRRT